MSEVQAFHLLSTLCDRLVPGYYSTTMYGTLLDQRVFESLVEKTMPILWDHMQKSDVQLSVVSLPWFLSLYINSMPLVFAFRVLDVFFLEGPKVLFQVGLAILRINGEELLDATDDGALIQILKNYFSRLDESAHPRSENEKLRAVTRFQELMVVAFKEFSGITQSTILEQRAKHKDAVLSSIESFAKRTALRNLGPDSKRLEKDDLGNVYDRFYKVLYERQEREAWRKEEEAKLLALKGGKKATGNDSLEKGRVGLGPSATTMDYDAFREFLSGIASWAVSDEAIRTHQEPMGDGWLGSNQSARDRRRLEHPWGGNPEPADHEFIRRVFRRWDTEYNDALSLQNVVSGLAAIKGNHKDIMGSISWFFELYDDDGDGRVDKDGILKMSEALLFITRRAQIEEEMRRMQAPPNEEPTGPTADEKLLKSISSFIQRCFEYADPSNEQPSESSEGKLIDLSSSSPRLHRRESAQSANLALDPQKPLHITLPTFRMVVLSEEPLEQFFEHQFVNSFVLLPSTSNAPIPTALINRPQSGVQQGGLRGVLDSIVNDGMRVAAEVRRRMEEEVEKAAAAGNAQEDDEDEEGGVEDRDRDLLKGAEAEVETRSIAPSLGEKNETK